MLLSSVLPLISVEPLDSVIKLSVDDSDVSLVDDVEIPDSVDPLD